MAKEEDIIIKKQNRVPVLNKAYIISIILSVLFILLNLGNVHAALPPRPPIDPVDTEKGAFIKLNVIEHHPDIWTEVQWEDAHGEWHPVEGWRGTLDDGTIKRWWVAPEDFGTGPFRWVVYESRENQDVLATSDSFYLPERANETVHIDLLLALE